jgi:hypothetical protein
MLLCWAALMSLPTIPAMLSGDKGRRYVAASILRFGVHVPSSSCSALEGSVADSLLLPLLLLVCRWCLTPQ